MDKMIGKCKTFNAAAWTKRISVALALSVALFSILFFAVQKRWSDMALSFGTIAFVLTPFALERLLRFRVTPCIYVLIIVYTVCPLLGSSYRLYLKLSWWDDMLHGFAGLVFAMFGAYLPYRLNKKNASLPLCVLSAFVFSVAVSCVWEFVEFGMDSFFGTDMQKDTWLTSLRPSYLLGKMLGLPESVLAGGDVTLTTTITNPDGTEQILNGYLDIGLLDTMHDMLIETTGALIYAVTFAITKGKKFVLIPVEKLQPALNDAQTEETLQEVAATTTDTPPAETVGTDDGAANDTTDITE